MVKSKIKVKTSKGVSKKGTNQASKNAAKKSEEKVLPIPVQKKGRQTNNSLASAVGQIVIHTCDEVSDIQNKKNSSKLGGSIISGYNYGYNFGIEEEERRIGMHKILNLLKDHEDAWPFIDPVDEQYAPRYYSVVIHPMDLTRMEEKLEEGCYKSANQFKRDFHLIIDNCRQYNGSDNEYTEMAMNLKEVFDRAVNRYLESELSSDDSLSITSSDSVSSRNFKNKNSTDTLVRQSQRHKQLRKITKKLKLNSKVNKNKSRQQVIETEVKEEVEEKIERENVSDKKNKKLKKCKNEVKLEEKSEEVKNKSAINDVKNVIKSKSKKSNDVEKIVLKNKKKSINEENESKPRKTNKKCKKETKEKKDLESPSVKESKESRKRKEILNDSDVEVIPQNKSRKFEKKETKTSDNLIDKVRNSKVKTKESQKNVLEETEQIVLTSGNNKKHRKTNKEKPALCNKQHDKVKENKSKKKNDSIDNGELKNEVDSKSTERFVAEKVEPHVTVKDIESLDNLKDRISKKRRVEKLLNKEKKKKSLKSDSLHTVSKKVPSNGSTYNQDIHKLDNKLKLNKSSKEKSTESKSQNQEDKKSKKIKTYSKLTKGNTKRNVAIQELDRVTEETLNDINKWLDNAPRLSEFSASNDSSVSRQSDDLPHSTKSKQLNVGIEIAASKVTTTANVNSNVYNNSSIVSVNVISSNKAGTTIVNDSASRKRSNSNKLLGFQASARPKKIQRTIDRLQPGKSKGNLLSKKLSSVTNEGKLNCETAFNQTLVSSEQPSCEVNDEPKLSLGTVLKNVDSIQLICKSLVSSPNPHDEQESHDVGNDEEDDDHHHPDVEDIEDDSNTNVNDNNETINNDNSSNGNNDNDNDDSAKKSTKQLSSLSEETSLTAVKNDKDELPKQTNSEEIQKPKMATPNLSAWFKAFGTPKSKKREEEEVETAVAKEIPAASIPTLIKKEENFESSAIDNRQRRMSTGGSSMSESASSFSQESPPSRTGRSPQHNQPVTNVMVSPLAIESQIRGAGFYQDALSTGSSPYNSPYYTTPPRYSAQLPPTPSPQHHPLSPAYPANYDAPTVQIQPPSLYTQISPQSHPNFQKPSPQPRSPSSYSQQSPQTCFSQNSPQPELQQSYTSPVISAGQSQSPVYPQQSVQSSPYSQLSPQPASYSQPSPQSQPSTPGYCQSSPQTPASNYSQTSPSQATSINFSQPSPQQQHSPYSQSSPQPLPSYSQSSPQSQQSPYSQASPQQTGSFSQVSPRPPSVTYSQPSPQPLGYAAQTPSPYSQSDLVIAQPSPQARGYSQSPPLQSSYSLSSKTLSSCSAPPVSSQQQTTTYTQSVPPTPTSYLQMTSEQTSPIQTARQLQQPGGSFPQSTTESNQQLRQQLQQQQASVPVTKYISAKEKQTKHQQLESSEQNLIALNQPSIFHSTPGAQYPSTYPNNTFLTNNKLKEQLASEPSSRLTSGRLTTQELQQQNIQQKQVQPGQEQSQQSQLLNFQQNLTSHDSLYTSGFQGPYSMSNTACRSVYPGYFDTSSKTPSISTNSNSSLTPMKKRVYNELSVLNDTSAAAAAAAIQVSQRASQEQQFGFDALMALAHSQTDVSIPNQFDSAFKSSLVDPVTSNPAYARLQLGLVGRNAKDTQQLLSLARPQGKVDALSAYARSSTPGKSELELNLIQNLQSVSAKTSAVLSMPRQTSESLTLTNQSALPAKTKKSKKTKQQQQQQQKHDLNIALEQQSGIAGFSQYGASISNTINLKQSTVGSSAFNFTPSTSSTSSSAAFYDKDASASAAAAAYAFLDDFRNPNLPNYYTMALRQQQQQQQQATAAAAAVQQQTVAHQQQQQQQQQQQTDSAEVSQQAKISSQTTTAARNYVSHPFLHPSQRPSPYATASVPTYVTPHSTNLGVDPAAYQQYLHSLYALQPPPHHRPGWI